MMMTVTKRAIAGAALAIGAALPAHADVLNFDDLSGYDFFTSNYHGFSIGDNSRATNAWFYSYQYDANYRAHSGENYIATDYTLYDPNLNPYEATMPISRATAFIFDGAWFSGGDTIGYQLRYNNALVYTSLPSAAITATPTFVASGYNGLVNQVIVFGRQGFYALDDFTYREAAVTAGVPEPATWGTMIAGFGLVAGALRYRRRKTVASIG